MGLVPPLSLHDDRTHGAAPGSRHAIAARIVYFIMNLSSVLFLEMTTFRKPCAWMRLLSRNYSVVSLISAGKA